MPDVVDLQALHFLRPGWFLVIPLILLVHWRVRKAIRAAEQWQTAIAPHLLQHLTIGGGGNKLLRPYQVMTLSAVLLSIALAGPTWRKEITPFTEDTAPLIVVLEMTSGMQGIDQPPTRLERAKQKIRDILERRQGARTAVIAYAGSAHAVLPLTDDARLVEIYLDSLTPERMPQEGDRPDLALNLATGMLADETAAGTVVFMTDGIDRSYAPVFEAFVQNSRDQVLLVAFGTDEGGPIRSENGGGIAPGVDMAGLEAISSASGGTLIQATVDESDVNGVINRVRTHLVNAIENDGELNWHDAGYYLVWPLALLALTFFRRGWTVQWQ
ncbi:MAG: VWA domain-containing protein [Gammaproteobacteria bacterium]